MQRKTQIAVLASVGALFALLFGYRVVSRQFLSPTVVIKNYDVRTEAAPAREVNRDRGSDVPKHVVTREGHEIAHEAKHGQITGTSGNPTRHRVPKTTTEVVETTALPGKQPAVVDRKKNGTWYSVGQDREIFIYSAFYDDRPAIHNPPVVRLIAVGEKSIEDQRIYCQLIYPGQDKPEVHSIEPTAIGVGVSKHGRFFREFVLICPIKNKGKVPSMVGVTENEVMESRYWIPVQVPPKPKQKPKDVFCSCVSVTYWFHEPYKIVEWMELHKLFGLAKVTVYNNSLAAESSRIFQHYDGEGFVDFRHSSNFIDDPAENTIHLHMSPVINDCLLRNMHQCNKIVVTDLDEMIVSRKNQTYPEMIAEIESSQSSHHPARSYTFRNSYFFFGLPEDKTQPKQMVTLRHRKRIPENGPGYSVKSIIDPQACTNMHNHFCWRVASKHNTNGHNLDVDPKFGLNQHYKKCHFDAYHNKRGECDRMYATALDDDIMLRYRKPLLKQVSAQLVKLKMDPLE